MQKADVEQNSAVFFALVRVFVSSCDKISHFWGHLGKKSLFTHVRALRNDTNSMLIGASKVWRSGCVDADTWVYSVRKQSRADKHTGWVLNHEKLTGTCPVVLLCRLYVFLSKHLISVDLEMLVETKSICSPPHPRPNPMQVGPVLCAPHPNPKSARTGWVFFALTDGKSAI